MTRWEFHFRNRYNFTGLQVVMGNSGKGAFSSFVTGSVSQYVIHHVKCPVLIVK